MDRIIFGGTSEPFKRAPYLPKVKRRCSSERLVIQFGLALNALVISIIIYAELILR